MRSIIAVTTVRSLVRDTTPRPVDIVVTSSAGYPLDTTFYQSVKGMVAAMEIVKPGGTIILAAGLSEGSGSEPFQRIFRENTSPAQFMDRITTSGFRLSLQEQEANLQDHGAETVGYIAWQPSGGDFNGIGFEIDRTERAVTHAFMDIAFSEPHLSAPVFLGQMQSVYGKDTADLQWRAKDSHGVEVRIAEETSKDSETNHTAEVVGYMQL